MWFIVDSFTRPRCAADRVALYAVGSRFPR
jgi:hypothetical protein